MSGNTATIKKASRLSVFTYSFGDLASQFVWTFVGSYLTIFYTDVVGLAPGIIAAIMIAARIWDAINDPIMGAIAENSHSRWGRFRPWIAFGCIPLAIFSVLTFTHPFKGAGTPTVVYLAVMYIGAGMLYTMVNLPYNTLSSVMTEDSNQRNVLNTSRGIGMNLGIVLVNALSAGLLLFFSKNPAMGANGQMTPDGSGYFKTAVVYACIAVPLFLILFFTTKEVVFPKHKTKFSFKDTFLNLIRNKYLMVVTLIMTIMMTAFMGRIAIAAFYVIYCLGSFQLIALIMTLPSVLAIVGSFFVPSAAKRFGKRNVMMVTLFLQAVGLLIIYLSPFDNLPMIIIGDCIFGIFNVGMPMSLSMVADSVDYVELKTGKRTDGTAYATYGLATKFGNAFGGAFGILLLSAFGYLTGDGAMFAMQAADPAKFAHVQTGINIVVNLIPAILFAAAGLCCLLWRMTDKQADEIRAKLRAQD